MPDSEKEKLVRLCERQQVALIEDDTYAAMGRDDIPLKAVKAWDRSGSVIYCASLRKTLAPGMRLGWIAGGRWQARINMLKYAQSRVTETLSQLAVAEVMASSAHDRHLARLRRVFTVQREQMADASASHFPAGTRLSVPGGSMLLWVELPPGTSAQAVFNTAIRQGIRVSPGSLFSNSSRFDHFLRISCGAPYSAQADEALRKLAGIVSVEAARAGAG